MRDEFFDWSVDYDKFYQWAVKNDPPNLENWFIYHPICRKAWEARGIHPPQYVIDKEMKMRGEDRVDSAHA